MAAVARMASATSVPATKRVETRWPRRERSATARSDRLSDRAIKSALSTLPLVVAGWIVADWDCQRPSLALQYFLSHIGVGCSDGDVGGTVVPVACLPAWEKPPGPPLTGFFTHTFQPRCGGI